MKATSDLNKKFHGVYNLQYHLVLLTSDKAKCLDEIILSQLEIIFATILEKWDCELIEFKGSSNYVHLLISINPNVRLSRLIANLKTVSSRLIRNEFKEHIAKYYSKPVLWHRNYCLITSGGVPLSIIDRYIKNQEIRSEIHNEE